MRLFFAISVKDSARLWAHLVNCGPGLAAAGYRAVPRENLHLTLNFIGEADPSLVERLISRALGVAVRPFTMTIASPVMGLPDMRNPRVLAYRAVDTGGQLATLSRVLGNTGAGGLLPHVTVARAKQPLGMPQLPDLPPIEVQVTSFCLMNSELRQQGALHSVIEQFTLS